MLELSHVDAVVTRGLSHVTLVIANSVVVFVVVDLTVFVDDIVVVAQVSMQFDFVKNLFPFPAHPPYMKLIQLNVSLSNAYIGI